MSKNPVVVLVSFRIKPGMEEVFKQELMVVIKQSILEPNCININMYQSLEEPTQIMLYETWTDKDYFVNVQLQKPYYKPYLAKTKPMWASPREFTYWEMVAENVGSSGVVSN